MKAERVIRLKKLLEETHSQFVLEDEISRDALAPALRFKKTEDLELAGFICAVLAYGKVAHIQKSVRRVLDPMGESPASWLRETEPKLLLKVYSGWSHRFNVDKDIVLLLSLLRQVYKKTTGLEAFFKPTPDESAADFLERFVEGLTGLTPEPFRSLPPAGSSFWFLLPRPSGGSACKRLNLFLRWMVGGSEMDLSLWKSFSRSNLVVPVDTHLLKQARSLRLTARKSADWQTAAEITEKLKLLDPNDPTRFDFALCHLGMKGRVLEPTQ